MRDVVSTKTVDLRESERQEIERQVEEFLKKGGQIETVTPPQIAAAPKGAVWRPRIGGLDI